MAIQTDGYQTTISFSSAQIGSGVTMSNILKERELTPPGISGGGGKEVTTMRNTTWRTFQSKSLKTLMPFTILITYDTELYDQMMNMINDNQELTITFPDSSELVFWGFVDEFVPSGQIEGGQPTATVTIIPTNLDADDSDAECGPNYTG